MENNSITFLVAYVDRLFWLPKEHMIAAPCLEDAVKLFLQRIQKRRIRPMHVLAIEIYEYDVTRRYPKDIFLGSMRADGSMVIEHAPTKFRGDPFNASHFRWRKLVRMKRKKYLQ